MAFILLALFFLPVVNGDLLYTWQEHNLFVNRSSFFEEIVSKHGLFAWMGCYLTQFFYYPWLGSSILISIWVATYYLVVDAFKMKDAWTVFALIPLVALLISIIQVGYWLYYLKMPGYSFAFSLQYLAAAIVTWCFSKLKIWVRWKNAFMAIIFIVALLLLGYRILVFSHNGYTDSMMANPHIVAALSPLFYAIHLRKVKLNVAAKGAMGAFVFSVLCLFVNMKNVSDNNFHTELSMYRALDESRYDDVINEAKGIKQHPTNLMVLYKNIALLHTDKLTDMFLIDNCGGQPNADEKLNVRIAQISGEMVYYQLGQTFYSYRWAIENGVKYGMTVSRLKMLVRCAILNKEFDVAYKYISILKATTFQKTWAIEMEKMLTDVNALVSHHEFKTISPLVNDVSNYLDTDNGMCEKWILEHFSDIRFAQNDKLETLLLCSSLWTEDDYAFLIHFYDYYQKHNNEPTPQLYQEALLLLADSEESPITLNDFPFDENVKKRFEQFAYDYQMYLQQGLDTKAIANKMKPLYGNSYWWYYYFYNDFIIY